MGYCVTSDVGGGDYRVNLSWSFHFPGFAQIERKVFIELFVEPVMGEGINDLLILRWIDPDRDWKPDHYDRLLLSNSRIQNAVNMLGGHHG